MPEPAAANPLIQTITAPATALRDRSLRSLIEGQPLNTLLDWVEELESFRRSTTNLYERVRASMFLHAIYRYDLQESPGLPVTGTVPFEVVQDLHERRFEQAIAGFRRAAGPGGPSGPVASALARAYEEIALQTLADQVRRSVRGCRGNRWMFRVGSAEEHALRIVPPLLERDGPDALFPILSERTPVRLDLSHSGWSDIFFLGMDYPEGARVLNISVDLGVYGRDDRPRPPIATFCRVIPEPILRLTSLDLGDTKDVTTLEDLFNFGSDYLGLIKAGVIAAGLVPPSLEGSAATLGRVLDRLVGPGHGLEVVSQVNDIPKGSRLAVSTNLLVSLITLLMRATGQTRNLAGPLEAETAPVVVARAVLGEWLGGSGGGWQDSGGVYPGVKVIRGVPAESSDPEHNVSRGRLLPSHQLLDRVRDLSPFHEALARSLVLVHGGMAQNVGPILNMVTSKYLLRSDAEWAARGEALAIFDQIVAAVERADIRELGRLTSANWAGPLKRIIPWVTNRFTESIIERAQTSLGDDYWGFLMLGGMSGGGMAFFVAPHRRDAFRDEALRILREVKKELDDALPFAMEPVVYDFAINPHGTVATLSAGSDATMPTRYYAQQVPRLARLEVGSVDPLRHVDLDQFATKCAEPDELARVFRATISRLFPVARSASDPAAAGWDKAAERIRRDNGFDPIQHEQLREDLQRGRIGLARNRLPVDTEVEDVEDSDLVDATRDAGPDFSEIGAEALRRGLVAVVTLAAGVGSRWTTGAGVVKALNPFAMFQGRHRSFLEVHLAKTRHAMRRFNATVPHVVTTSYLTHGAVERHLARTTNYGHEGPVFLSRGQSIAQRLIPMTRDLTFLWEEQAHEALDENKQKVREASRRAVLGWARSKGEGADYVDNVPVQRFNPPGHFYEVPNLLRNGVLARLLWAQPALEWLMIHNVDTLGADLDPGVFGLVLERGSPFAFEVIPRRLEDRGGGLARVGGRLRLLEGLAQPRDEVEFRLRYYNTLTTWVRIDGLLDAFELTRRDLDTDPARVAAAVRAMAARVPTYVTIKDVKRRWGHAQEDVLPVCQFEKLWGDLTALPDLDCSFVAVDRRRGQQLKDPSQLDGWANDGSRDYVASLCDFAE